MACFNSEEIDLLLNVADKINPVINKSVAFIYFKVKSKIRQEAEKCLNAVVADIKIKQEEISNPILEQKKSQLRYLIESLKLAEETSQVFFNINIKVLFSNDQFASRVLIIATMLNNAKEVKDLRETINNI